MLKMHYLENLHKKEIMSKKQEFENNYEEFHLHHGQIRKLMEHPRGNIGQLKTQYQEVCKD
jgi:hypothetical protein